MVVLWNTKAKTGLLPTHIYLPSCSSFFPDFSGFFIIQVDLITKWQGQETRSSNPNWWVCLTLLVNFLFFPLELPPFGFSLLSLSLCDCSLLRLLCHDYYIHISAHISKWRIDVRLLADHVHDQYQLLSDRNTCSGKFLFVDTMILPDWKEHREQRERSRSKHAGMGFRTEECC